VLQRSAFAAGLTVAACYPRLAFWQERAHAVAYLLAVMFICTLFLWAFVFAWHRKYTGQDVFRFRLPATLWINASLTALIVGVVSFLFLDPILRKLTPQDYPHDVAAWAAMTLFSLAMEQLFLYFAPFALFMRLFRSPRAAMVSTVIFVVFLLCLKSSSSATPPPVTVIMGLAIFRLVVAWASVQFFAQGGAILQSWWTLLLQARFLFSLSES